MGSMKTFFLDFGCFLSYLYPPYPPSVAVKRLVSHHFSVRSSIIDILTINDLIKNKAEIKDI